MVFSYDELWATVEDLEARWRGLTESEAVRAETLIVDAMSLIKDECPHWDSSTPETRRRVVCAVVQRAMGTPTGEDSMSGVASTMVSAGPYSQQFTFKNPSGDLYLTKAEKRAFKGKGGGAFSIDLLSGGG